MKIGNERGKNMKEEGEEEMVGQVLRSQSGRDRSHPEKGKPRQTGVLAQGPE